MKATVEEINSVQRRLMVVISSDDVNKAFDSAYLKLKKSAKVQGFRPGKAPVTILKKLYESQVSYEVGESLINQHLFQAIDSNGFKPIARPFVEVKEVPTTGKDYQFSAVVDILPVIKLDEKYKELSIKTKTYTTNESSVQKELEKAAKKFAKTSPIEDASTKAANGLLAVISHEASIEGKELEEMKVKSAQIELGKNEILPELESAVIGLKKGETTEVDIKVPDDYEDSEIKGKTVNFKIVVDDLLKIEYPEFNDDFAKDLNFDTIVDLKEEISKQLKTNAERMTKQTLEKNLIEELANQVPFEVPPALVDQVIDGIIHESNFKNKKDRENALKNKELRSHYQAEAKKTARNTLLLWELVKTEKLEVSDDEIREHVKSFAPEHSKDADMQISQTIKQYGEKIRENLLFEKATKFLAEHSNIENETVEL